ncbi:MAG: hypothetical protein ACM3Y9_10705 [Ignavibacteria bacterium]
MSLRFPERSRTQAASRQFAASTGGKRVSPSLTHKILDAQRREQQLILAELAKIKGFMPLLMKHRNGGAWSGAERTELVEQLRAVAHLSPYLFILMLPGSFVLLPVFAWWLDRRRQRRFPGAD